MATQQSGPRQTRAGSDRAERGFAARVRASRPVQAAIASAALALAILIAGAIMLLTELRTRELEDSRRALLSLNALVAENTGRTLDSVELVLQSVLEELRDAEIATPSALAQLRTSRAFQEALKSRAAGLPQLEAISVVDTGGRLVSYSRDFPIPDIDLSDRDHFQQMKKRRGDEAFVSEPVQNRSTGAWTVYLARPILGRSGNFIGIVYGGINLDYFQRSFARVATSGGASVSLWRFDGTLLVRHPIIGDIGRRFDTPAFRDLSRHSQPIVYETNNSISGAPTVVARHVVQGFPVATAFARTRADILKQSQQEEAIVLIAAALLAIAIVAVTGALTRQFWAYEAVARAEGETAAAIEGLGELEDQLRQSQKLEVIGQLTSGVAHDFNNLLTVVIGNLDRMTRRFGAAQPDLVRYIDNARSGAERAAGLSQKLLAFSRRQPLEPMRLDVNEIIGGLTDLLQQSLGKRAVLGISLAPGLPPIHVDRVGFESALLNLVVNARDAMPDGGRVEITTSHADGEAGPPGLVRIAVQDTGTGMIPEVVARAFEPFFTTKEAGVGTGLGLAQVAGFARQSGGTVEIETGAGQGCRVTICLPALTSPQAGGSETRNTPLEQAPVGAGSPADPPHPSSPVEKGSA